MYKVVVVTHGPLANAFKETLKMFTNETDDVYPVGLTETGVEKFKERITETLNECYEEGKEILVLADLFGGTPFNTAMLEIKAKYKDVEIITGINLPLLIEASLLKASSLKDIIETLRESAKDAIMVPTITNTSDEDE